MNSNKIADKMLKIHNIELTDYININFMIPLSLSPNKKNI